MLNIVDSILRRRNCYEEINIDFTENYSIGSVSWMKLKIDNEVFVKC
jgi:hypothetical protein